MVMRLINRRQLGFGVAWAWLLQPVQAFSQAQDGEVETIRVMAVSSQILGPESPPTAHWGLQTSSGQPVLTLQQGKPCRLRFANDLAETVWLHFFGLRGPADMMTVEVKPGPDGATELAFTPPDAGTFWLGPLIHAAQAREMGLALMVVVEEAQPQPFTDIPMIFDDWSLGDDGVIEQDFANLDRAAGGGRLGNWFTVNGQYKPRITLGEGPARLRLLNVANTRAMVILFKAIEGAIIARDGQPTLAQDLREGPITLQPGQRADVWITEAQADAVIALDLFEDVVEVAFLQGRGYRPKAVPPNYLLPLNPLPPVDPSMIPRSISLAVEGGIKGSLKSARVGKDVLELRAMLEQGLAWSIGGTSGLGSQPLFEAQKGEVLQLAIENKTAFEQPLHIHGHCWQLVEVAKASFIGPPRPQNWSDTVVVPQGAVVKLLLVANNPGTWAIHSLLAERCDAGLIGSFTVADMP